MRKTLYFTVFISGLTSLAIEMAASRLIGNTFGTSNLVWAAIIGLILIYLTVGYFIGGKWADRSPHMHTFFSILIWAAAATALVPVAAHPVLKFAADAFDHLQVAVLAGSFFSVIVLLIIPVTLLGMASPFAIRLAIQDSASVGSVSGRIYAISTLGSFLGTFLPVLVTIPLLGTNHTFVAFAGLLAVVALFGLQRSSGWKATLPYLWVPLLLVIIWFWGFQGTNKNSQGQIFETESAYNYIQVLEVDGFHYLRLNEGQGVHSVYHPSQINYHGPWEQVLIAPFFNPAPVQISSVKRAAIIGLAAGTTARQLTAVYGAIPIDGFEIDPIIIAVGQKYFGMTEPNLNPIVQDGRWGLAHRSNLYDIISVDAYRPPYIPAHLTTREFFEIVRVHLTPTGVVAINVGRAPGDRSLINSLSSTLLTVFSTVQVVDVPNSFNSMVFASSQPISGDNLILNRIALGNEARTPALLLETMDTAIANLQPQPPAGQVFTDDQAPIEWITNNMVLRYLISGNVEKQQ